MKRSAGVSETQCRRECELQRNSGLGGQWHQRQWLGGLTSDAKKQQRRLAVIQFWRQRTQHWRPGCQRCQKGKGTSLQSLPITTGDVKVLQQTVVKTTLLFYSNNVFDYKFWALYFGRGQHIYFPSEERSGR